MTSAQRTHPRKRTMRQVVVASVLVLALLAAWRISHRLLADAALVDGDPAAALGWDADHPEALLRRAETQLAGNDVVAAAATARHLLQVEPTDGRGYRILAQVAAAQGQSAQALAMFGIAARRAPRDLPTRVWLAQQALERRDWTAALVQIDKVLTLSPSSGTSIFPVLLSLARQPGFADALADALQRNPPWRAGMLEALRQASQENRRAADQVFGALQDKGGMDQKETDALIDALLRGGHWGEAYAWWAAPLVANGTPLPVLFNAGFLQEPTSSGFDWRMPDTPGVILELQHGHGTGRNVHVRFLARRVVGAFLEHPLLLPPGAYRLGFRQRSDGLRSENGISWTLVCANAPTTSLAESRPLNGSHPWAVAETSFVVPAAECQGQWLRLANAGGLSIGQVVGGDAWFDALSIQRTGAPREAPN